MAKLSAGMADKLKNLARNVKEDNSATGIKGVAAKIKQQTQSNQKQSMSDGKVSGRKS